MKAMELIERLQSLVNEHGDLDIKMLDSDQILENVEDVNALRPMMKIEEPPFFKYQEDPNQNAWCFEISF